MVARQVVVRDNFQEGFGHYTDQSTHLEKVKTNRRGPEDSIRMDWTFEGFKAANKLFQDKV